MPDHPSAMSGTLRRPFAEQVAFFRNKLGNLVPTRRWDDVVAAEHDTAFMVAGAQKADLLADLAAAVDRAIAEGKSLDAFRKDFDAAVARNDWHGWTGEDTKAGRAWRTRTIYRANATTSYAAGRLAQLRAANYAFWVYFHGGSQEPRVEHLSWNGLPLPPDHPFWRTHYPPSDWGCSCYVSGARSERGVRRLGGDPSKTLPGGWNALDPRTGAPAGIGRGWGYAPGNRVAGTVQAVAEKLRRWDYQIGKDFLADLPVAQRDALTEAYRRLPSVADDARRYARRVAGQSPEAVIQPQWTLGALTSAEERETARAIGGELRGYDYSLSPGGLAGRGRGDGTPAGIDDYALLPAIISNPDLREDGGTAKDGVPLVRLEKAINGRRYIAWFAVRPAQRTLVLFDFVIR